MPRRALLVDDDPLSRELIASMLAELGCETLTARSGTEALRQLANDHTIEMLFADINMPGLSGTELAMRARDFRPELRVLLLSGLRATGVAFLCCGNHSPNPICAEPCQTRRASATEPRKSSSRLPQSCA
jgi:CheY-like chemotaxis protein